MLQNNREKYLIFLWLLRLLGQIVVFELKTQIWAAGYKNLPFLIASNFASYLKKDCHKITI